MISFNDKTQQSANRVIISTPLDAFYVQDSKLYMTPKTANDVFNNEN